MRQGNDAGTRYRSAISFDTEAHRRSPQASRAAYGERLLAKGDPEITTEIARRARSTTPRIITSSTCTNPGATPASAAPASAARLV